MISDNNIEHLPPTGKSSHETLVLSLHMYVNKKQKEQEFKYDLSKGNFAQMGTEFDEFDWGCILDTSKVA